MRKGFTLIELLVVIVIIGILVAIALPNFIKIKDKAKEAEVKQNLHAIQLAVERYGVDSPGNYYPEILMGGDWTDSRVVWQDWVDDQELVISDHTGNPDRISQWEAADSSVGDTLVMEAYMPSYPGNPFIKTRSDALLPTLDHNPGVFPNGFTSGAPPWTRIVGGRESNKMVEVFGPCQFTPYAQTVGDWNVHHIYFNPEYDTLGDVEKVPPGGYEAPSGNRNLTGNFSYWPRSSNPKIGWLWVGVAEVAGFTLAGYGAPRSPGQDVYNRNGNYVGRFRTEPCDLDCEISQMGDVPCICNSGADPSRTINDGGSDTVPDGVCITLDSGLDKKSGATNFEVTEGAS